MPVSSIEAMRRALDLAKQGVGQTSPNPTVGAVLVRDHEIVGEGFHIWQNKDHAEVVAIRAAGEKAKGSTLYVTLEPCSHTGRTGPCTAAVIEAGISKVVAAVRDPNPVVSGSGFDQLKSAGVAVEIDETVSAEATTLNEPFFHFMKTGKPLVTLKAAVTLDGKIAAPEDNDGWITSIKARTHVQTLRHQHDTILTGIGTVLSDNPRLSDRSGLPRSRPFLRIVMDSQLRLPPEYEIVQNAKDDLLVVCTSAASPERRKTLESKGVEVVALDGPDGRASLQGVVDLLAQRKYLSLMIEAGSKVNWAALEADIVDKIFFYYAPKILGGLQSLPVAGGTGRKRRIDAIEFERLSIHPIPPDEYAIEAYVHRPH